MRDTVFANLIYLGIVKSSGGSKVKRKDSLEEGEYVVCETKDRTVKCTFILADGDSATFHISEQLEKPL